MAKHLTTVAWDETPHLDEAAKRGLISAYMPHELTARVRGVPGLGAGAIYPVPEEQIVCDPFQFPAWFRQVYALDVGWNRTACLWGAHDPDTDVLYLYDEYYRGMAEPAIHAAAIRARGDWIPGVIDPASRGRSQKDGETLFSQYEQLGLTLVPADNRVTGTEGGLVAVWQRLSTSRIKVFRTLQNFLAEYRIYRRSEKGQVVKETDHLMDCMRYLVMSGLGIATLRPYLQWPGSPGLPQLKKAGYQDGYRAMADAWDITKVQEAPSGDIREPGLGRFPERRARSAPA